MRILPLLLLLSLTGPAFAADVIVRDGDTIQIGNVAYELAGVDAPEMDQPCVDEHADNWACGTEARDWLIKLINKREVRCEDLGEDKIARNRRLGICTVAGEAESLNRSVVLAGYGVRIAAPANAGASSPADEAGARDRRQGLWRGCFVAPADFRSKAVGGKLLGASCQPGKETALRAALFPADLAMPQGCNIRAKQVRRAKLTGNVGVYLIPQCQNYATQPKPDRWFCSEDDARAAGYRKALNCQASSSRK
ncbi:thermonuclease family protein [Rhodopseudomonas boonkerdii]|uniref:thermonuclease family protein n=1 Tax=Rhodopseudomonas boonkerdii TaxID=475937 RepID=UPI001E44171C|nr:thermonuclease family protein [Rhodopseudomonas boonkerdii]UGV25092.1 thermonuclease family protein [Rhodopseudomonas boonkerdii]